MLNNIKLSKTISSQPYDNLKVSAIINDLKVEKGMSENRIKDQKSRQKIAYLNSQLIHKKLSYNLESLTKLVSSKNLNNAKDLYSNSDIIKFGGNLNIFKQDASIKEFKLHNNSSTQLILKSHETNDIQMLHLSYNDKAKLLNQSVYEIITNQSFQNYLPITSQFLKSLINELEEITAKIFNFNNIEVRKIHEQLNNHMNENKELSQIVQKMKDEETKLQQLRKNAFSDKDFQNELDQFDKMSNLKDEEYKIKKLIQREYAEMKVKKYGREQLNEDELELIMQQDLEPKFSDVNLELSEVYKVLIRFDDNDNYSRQFTAKLNKGNFALMAGELRDKLAIIQIQTAALVLKRFLKKGLMSADDEYKSSIFDMGRKIDKLKNNEEALETKIKTLEALIKELTAKNNQLNREIRELKDQGQENRIKVGIYANEIKTLNESLKKLEQKIFKITDNNKDLEKNLDFYKKKAIKDREITLRTVHNIKRLTLKLRKAQMIIFQMSSGEQEVSQLSLNSIDVPEFENEEINERESISLFQELSQRFEHHINSEIENIQRGSQRQRKKLADLPSYDFGGVRDDSSNQKQHPEILIQQLEDTAALENQPKQSANSLTQALKNSMLKKIQEKQLSIERPTNNFSRGSSKNFQKQNSSKQKNDKQDQLNLPQKEKPIRQDLKSSRSQNRKDKQKEQRVEEKTKVEKSDLLGVRSDYNKTSYRKTNSKIRPYSPKIVNSIKDDLLSTNYKIDNTQVRYRKPKHTSNFGVQVYFDKDQMLKEKYGWKKQFTNKMCQTDEYMFSKEAQVALHYHLKEYEKYFGPKMNRKFSLGHEKPQQLSEFIQASEIKIPQFQSPTKLTLVDVSTINFDLKLESHEQSKQSKD
ncbi:UNKNOWN [Stylonychia lemnae]|uniref:Uncharacterized protein n=1 Tax=Stylonychia lemnae TaxID=5949 RepID=A0A078B2J8_STYLE|nr:UNKNOWN [Stylonychia lemnae]|eukprot:CDW87447.1 UNKNOWN [Stylonychia lemnae]